LPRPTSKVHQSPIRSCWFQSRMGQDLTRTTIVPDQDPVASCSGRANTRQAASSGAGSARESETRVADASSSCRGPLHLYLSERRTCICGRQQHCSDSMQGTATGSLPHYSVLCIWGTTITPPASRITRYLIELARAHRRIGSGVSCNGYLEFLPEPFFELPHLDRSPAHFLQSFVLSGSVVCGLDGPGRHGRALPAHWLLGGQCVVEGPSPQEPAATAGVKSAKGSGVKGMHEVPVQAQQPSSDLQRTLRAVLEASVFGFESGEDTATNNSQPPRCDGRKRRESRRQRVSI
jgi:hypothetical protein